MKLVPLTATLNVLGRRQPLYMVNDGLVFLYPAGVVNSVAADTYTHYDLPWDTSMANWLHGTRVADKVAATGKYETYDTVRAGAYELWRYAARPAESEVAHQCAFARWWEYVDPYADPQWIGAAACVAAREVITTSLFHHRFTVDETAARA